MELQASQPAIQLASQAASQPATLSPVSKILGFGPLTNLTIMIFVLYCMFLYFVILFLYFPKVFYIFLRKVSQSLSKV
jgi:hypothetical protein